MNKNIDTIFDLLDNLRSDNEITYSAYSLLHDQLSFLSDLLKEQEKEIKALRLLIEWAEECNFGFDQFQDEYERYKDELKDVNYIDGMIYVAKRTLEDNGAFEEER